MSSRLTSRPEGALEIYIAAGAFADRPSSVGGFSPSPQVEGGSDQTLKKTSVGGMGCRSHLGASGRFADTSTVTKLPSEVLTAGRRTG